MAHELAPERAARTTHRRPACRTSDPVFLVPRMRPVRIACTYSLMNRSLESPPRARRAPGRNSAANMARWR
jgi:hypothetical protein